MKCLKTLVSRNYFLVVLLIIVLGCEKEEVTDEYAAKVNEVVLSENDLNKALNSRFNEKKYKDEYIRQWIETELLYQDAIDNDILNDENYKDVVEQSKKHLAASFMLDQYYEDRIPDFSSKELKSYFSKYINDFKLFDDAYVLNIADFSDESRAILFRYTLLESDWNSTLNAFQNDDFLVNVVSNQFLYKYQIRPIILFRTVKNLLPSETSIVLQTEPGVFTVVQLVAFLEKDSFPKYEYVENLVKERYEVTKKAELYREYIDELFVKHNVKYK
ncbi:hypothetical protein ACFLTH_07785 [Bacteroidota bacterium]